MIRNVLAILFALGNSYGIWHNKSAPGDGNQWAVLIAGSSGWSNYRHQADICHAFHLLKSRGIQQNRIITFMVDDIARNPMNPFPGKIFHDYEHDDYYTGVVINYKMQDVTVDNVVGVLLGSPILKAQGKKVLESGPNDEVFIFFSGHGSSGIVYLPDGELTATKLNDTITEMRRKRMYMNLLFYLDSCKSGSMFETIISSNIRVLTATAANPQELSHAISCEDTTINVCLADEFSYNWIEDAEIYDPTTSTVQEQIQRVQSVTLLSHVQKYGDNRLAVLPIGEFQGRDYMEDTNVSKQFRENKDLVSSTHSKIHMLRKQVKRNNDVAMKWIFQRKLDRALQLDRMAVETGEDIEQLVKKSERTTHVKTMRESLACHESVQVTYVNMCFKIQQVPAVAHALSRLVQLCDDGYNGETIRSAITLICQ